MVKVAVNRMPGRFCLSSEAKQLYKIRSGTDIVDGCGFYGCRTDPLLIQVIEELGQQRASGPSSKVKVVEIPDDAEWTIRGTLGGYEEVVENHRVW